MRADITAECPDQALLLDFLNEQLTIQELSALDAHVSTCPKCMCRLEQLINTRWGSGTLSMLSRSSEPFPLRFGKYDAVEEIAVGGMGSIWRVRDQALDRELAIKVIKSELAQRPNDGRPCYSMKLIEGDTYLKRHT